MLGFNSSQRQQGGTPVAFGWDCFSESIPKQQTAIPFAPKPPEHINPPFWNPIKQDNSQPQGACEDRGALPHINRPTLIKLDKKMQRPTQALSITMSLDRYLDLRQLLNKGNGSGQRLSELERGMMKLNDLKQVMALNGQAAGSKQKQELLDRLLSTQLLDPTYKPPPTISPSAPPAPPQLDTVALSLLDWYQGADSASTVDAVAGEVAAQGFNSSYSIALPEVRIIGAPSPMTQPSLPVSEPAVVQQVQAAHPQPTDSDVTLASQPPMMQHQQYCCVVDPTLPTDTTYPEVAEEEEEADSPTPEELPRPEPPAWLLDDIQRIAEDSQGSTDYFASMSKHSTPFLHRKIAFVLMEDFQQKGSNGITDTVARGAHEGQVVEYIGADHIDGTCELDCDTSHCFYYARVMVSSSDASRSTWHKRRMDLVVDLRPEVRVLDLEGLRELGESELLDAWVLLEPREEAVLPIEDGLIERGATKGNVTFYHKKQGGKRQKK